MRTSAWSLLVFCIVCMVHTACEAGPSTPGGGGGSGAPSHLASGLVGPEGGKVVVEGGSLAVDVPPGALEAELKLTVDVVAHPTPGAVGTVIDLGPSGTRFAKPVRVTFAIPEGLTAPRRLRVATAIGAGWTVLADAQRDLAAGTISGTTVHFSEFGLVEAGAAEGCAEDLDCEDDQICDERSRGCVERVACESDWDCRNAGELCTDGACRFACRQEEVCGNGVDDDCDEATDEDCPACDGGLTECRSFGAVSCVDTTLDPFNCGGCGITCGEREWCLDSTCQPDGSAGCRSDDDCDPAEKCVEGTCQSNGSFACRSDADCPPRMVCDEGLCR